MLAMQLDLAHICELDNFENAHKMLLNRSKNVQHEYDAPLLQVAGPRKYECSVLCVH